MAIQIVHCQLAFRKRFTRKETGDVERFERISPCSLGTLPCNRSTRRAVHKKKVCYIWRYFPEGRRASSIYFDSLCFSPYLKASSKKKVLTWIKKRQIFPKKYVLVPIVCWGHWSLLILCRFGESLQSGTTTSCMLLLDSLQMANPRRLEPDIRTYEQNRGELISQIPLLVPEVPQQINCHDCGEFVMYYIHLFVQKAPERFSIKDGYPYFGLHLRLFI
ncbi:Ulp1 peptidase [Bertholletia excelsa]